MLTATSHIKIRLRRTTTEEAYVSLPIEPDHLTRASADASSFELNVASVFKAAMKMGADPTVAWRLESAPLVELHPVQS
jgi:hypothetical protein